MTDTQKPLAIVLMGSSADLSHCHKITEALESFGVSYELRIGSAHKTPTHVSTMLAEYESTSRPKVYITVAGRSNALSGFTDGSVKAPVIACPPPSESHGGADLYSSIRMPSGIVPAYIMEPANAALFTAKIFALMDANIAKALAEFQARNAQKVINDDLQSAVKE